jgi:hypothetical protein
MLAVRSGERGMTWIIGIIAVIGFAYLMYANERFRRFGFGLLAFFAVIVGVIWLYSEQQNREWRERERAAREAIPHDQVVFRNLGMSGYDGNTMSGVVHNRGRFSLSSMRLTVRLRDCRDPEGNIGCVIVAEDTQTVPVNVPPGQARQFSMTLYFGQTPEVTGYRTFTVGLAEVVANIPRE